MPAKVLNQNEIKRVLAVIAAERYPERNRIIFQLSCLAGMRAIEISSVQVGDAYDEAGKASRKL
jgi:integrase/recombinase XerD